MPQLVQEVACKLYGTPPDQTFYFPDPCVRSRFAIIEPRLKCVLTNVQQGPKTRNYNVIYVYFLHTFITLRSCAQNKNSTAISIAISLFRQTAAAPTPLA